MLEVNTSSVWLHSQGQIVVNNSGITKGSNTVFVVRLQAFNFAAYVKEQVKKHMPKPSH